MINMNYQTVHLKEYGNKEIKLKSTDLENTPFNFGFQTIYCYLLNKLGYM